MHQRGHLPVLVLITARSARSEPVAAAVADPRAPANRRSAACDCLPQTTPARFLELCVPAAERPPPGRSGSRMRRARSTPSGKPPPNWVSIIWFTRALTSGQFFYRTFYRIIRNEGYQAGMVLSRKGSSAPQSGIRR